ncbi:transcriptional regulator, GntR family [Sulfitobacter marinus]|uniref:Transcriptional regulator, GntR family n=1 Tax=Sulfitobacter marinus TaxID=394264 RepID=A0A1I6V3L6_9RHOB|nr:FCD domain-containing protein [Sulfitobacter marinus]SFT08261.1 transcriptional regulator, GntR family [Sulfitobacter marinus]
MIKNVAARGLNFTTPLDAGSSLPTGVAKEAVEKLGRAIVNGDYPEGEPMPMESDLADALGFSRNTIRDAIKVLSGKGMVRTARRYGTRVRPVSEWSLLDADVISWHNVAQSGIGRMFVETTELRCIIEPAAAELAAERATPEQVGEILKAADAMSPGSMDVTELYAADCLFHCTILDATGNRMMRQLRPIIIGILRISYEYGVQTDNGTPVSREGHTRVAEAIRDRSGADAKREMEKMLDANRHTAKEYWEKRTSGAGTTTEE